MRGFSLLHPDRSAAPPAPTLGAAARPLDPRPDGPRRFGGNTIRRRLVLLSGALLLVLIATNIYLSRKLADNTAGTIETANLLGAIEQANNARIAFGEMRYWMTDLAVSLLTLSETKAKAAEARTEHDLDALTPLHPQAVAAIRAEVADYRDLASQAVEAYTDDQRVIGNTLLARARTHSIKADELLAAIVSELTAEAIAARDRVIGAAASAIRLSQITVAAAVLAGGVFTFLVVTSIARPLRRLVRAMNGLNAGNLDVEIPSGGPEE